MNQAEEAKLLEQIEEWNDADAVSYTHLDVYKRQAMNMLNISWNTWMTAWASLLWRPSFRCSTIWPTFSRSKTNHRPPVDRKSTRLNSSHLKLSRMPSSA